MDAALRFGFAEHIHVTSEVEGALFHDLRLLFDAHRYVHCARDVIVDTVDQFKLVIAIRNPTELR